MPRLFLAALISMSNQSASAESPYRVSTEMVAGRPYEVRTREDGKHINPSREFPNEVLFVLTPGHASLIVDDLEVQAAFLPVPAHISKKTYHPNGLIFRFPGISQQQAKQFAEELKKNWFRGFYLSCVQGACTELRDGSGIELKGGDAVFLHDFLSRVLSKGFVDSNGDPIETEIYKINPTDRSLEQYLEDMPLADLTYGTGSLVLTILFSLPGLKLSHYLAKKYRFYEKCRAGFAELGKVTQSSAGR